MLCAEANIPETKLGLVEATKATQSGGQAQARSLTWASIEQLQKLGGGYNQSTSQSTRFRKQGR